MLNSVKIKIFQALDIALTVSYICEESPFLTDSEKKFLGVNLDRFNEKSNHGEVFERLSNIVWHLPVAVKLLSHPEKFHTVIQDPYAKFYTDEVYSSVDLVKGFATPQAHKMLSELISKQAQCHKHIQLPDCYITETEVKNLGPIGAILKKIDDVILELSKPGTAAYMIFPNFVAIYNLVLEIESRQSNELWPDYLEVIIAAKIQLEAYLKEMACNPYMCSAPSIFPSLKDLSLKEWPSIVDSSFKDSLVKLADIYNLHDDKTEDSNEFLFKGQDANIDEQNLDYISYLTSFDPLKFWRKNKDKYPARAKIARDMLSIPATSLGMERVIDWSRKLAELQPRTSLVLNHEYLIFLQSLEIDEKKLEWRKLSRQR